MKCFNNLIKTIHTKEKLFQENQYQEFLYDQTLRLKEGKDFDLDKCKTTITKSTNDKIKDQFQEIIEAIAEKDFTPNHKKPTLNFESTNNQRKIIFP